MKQQTRFKKIFNIVSTGDSFGHIARTRMPQKLNLTQNKDFFAFSSKKTDHLSNENGKKYVPSILTNIFNYFCGRMKNLGLDEATNTFQKKYLYLLHW